MSIKGFKGRDGVVHQYDFNALTNRPTDPADGEDGGYYTPVVTPLDDDTVQFEFTPSKEGMPAVAPATVELPGGGSSENVSLHIGANKPTNGVLYWLDTSGDSTGDETEPVIYAVETNLTNVTIDNTAATVNNGESYAATLTADNDYTLSSVSVVMGGSDITGTNYSDGNIYIPSVTGKVAITATAVAVSEGVTTYSVTNNLVNVISDNSAVSVEENASYKTTLTVADGYELDNVTVTMGGVDVTADVYADGVISIAFVTGDVVITVTTVKQSEYTIDVPVNSMNSTLSVYEADGVTQTSDSVRCHFYSENFAEETEVEVTMEVSETNYATIKYWVADAINKKAIVGGEHFPKGTTYYEPNTSYVAILTVPAGYGIAVSVSNNNATGITVTAKKKG